MKLHSARRRVNAMLQTEIERGLLFLCVPVLFGLGAIIFFTLPSDPPRWLLPAGAAVFALMAFLARRSANATRAALGGLIMALGGSAATFETWRASTAMAGSEITTRVTATLVQIEDRPNGRKRLTFDIIGTERPQLRYAPQRMRATAREVPGDLLPGDVFAGVVRILPATGPVRPWSYDFSFENYFAGIGANGFFLAGPFPQQVTSEVAGTIRIAAYVERARMALAERIRSHLSGTEGEVAAALVAGVRGGIPEEVNEALRRTGLAHILAISGLHMALVAASFVGMIRYGFALFPATASRVPVKKIASVIALLAISIYLVISGAAVAAQRAYIMFAVMLIAVLFDRPAITMRNLAIAAIIVLAISPHEIMGPSFQMSFAATAALIAGYGWYNQRRGEKYARGDATPLGPPGLARKILVFFGGLAATSIIAGVATGLFGAWHFQRISPLGLFANLAAMPIVTLVVMPSAVLATLMVPVGLDGPLFLLMGEGISATVAVAHWFAARTHHDVVGMLPPLAVGLLTLALLIATLATTALRMAALPLLLAGGFVLYQRELPQVFVSEDARQMAVSTGDHLAINRARPSQFTIQNWQSALQTPGLLRPVAAGTGSSDAEGGVFACGDGLCTTALSMGGPLVAHADSAQTALPACGRAALLIIDDATAQDICADQPATMVVTKRDLALRGSLAIWLDREGVSRHVHALPETLRPWHAQRRFSREARGMAPYQRPDGGED